MKKYVHSLSRYFLIYALGFIPFYLFNSLIDVIYNILSDKAPGIFPSYNALTERESLLSLEATLALVASLFTVFVLTVLTVKYDNERYERIISETDGLYRLREGCALYVKNYLIADVICAILVPIPFFALGYVSFPDGSARALRMLEDAIGTLTSPSAAFTDKLGTWLGIAAAMLTSLISRLPACYMGLKRWRGLWLSNFDG